MKRKGIKRILVLATVLVALSSVVACSSGVSQEEYDGLAGQLADAESQLQTLTTRIEEIGQQSDDSLAEARSLVGQRGRSNQRASAYLEVALAVLNFGGGGEESVIDEMAKLSSPLAKIGSEDAAYEDLTTRLLRSTDTDEIQQALARMAVLHVPGRIRGAGPPRRWASRSWRQGGS